VRAVVQRVSEASVTVDGEVVGAIRHGLCVLLGVGVADEEREAELLCRKIVALRVFEDDAGRFDRSVQDVGGSLLVVSQFTLYGDVRKGRRPSFDGAAAPDDARRLYEEFVRELRATHVPVATGEFQAMMQVELVNDGPVTIVIDSRKQF
jgi:D-tyrosyl-tRNA(Tyr) deacylase